MPQTHIFYSGNVQGVGFRFTVRRYAAEEGLTGWVRNLVDGRVEALLEGEESALEGALRKIEAHFEGYISGKERQDRGGERKFETFEIVH